MKPLVSVILPVYRGERYLAEAIQSVSRQTFSSWELLVGEDELRDESSSKIQGFTDDRIFLYHRKPSEPQGLFANLNRLIRRAQGSFIHILCQDDALLPRCLEEEISFLKKWPEVGMAYSGILRMDEESRILGHSEINRLAPVVKSPLALQHLFFHGCLPGNLSSVVIRKTTLEQVGYFNESMKVSGDYDMWVRLCEVAPLGVIPIHLVSLRVHREQLSQRESSIVPFIRENRVIRNRISRRLAAINGWQTRWYETFHYGVAHFHSFASALKKGKLRLAQNIISNLGVASTVGYGFFWLLSVNGRYFRPRAPFVLTEDERRTYEAMYAALNSSPVERAR